MHLHGVDLISGVGESWRRAEDEHSLLALKHYWLPAGLNSNSRPFASWATRCWSVSFRPPRLRFLIIVTLSFMLVSSVKFLLAITHIDVWLKGNIYVPSVVVPVNPAVILFILDNSWPSSFIVPCNTVGVALEKFDHLSWVIVFRAKSVAFNVICLS